MCVFTVLGREKNVFRYSLHWPLFAVQGCMFQSYKNRLNFEGVGGQQPRKKAILAIRSLMLIKNVEFMKAYMPQIKSQQKNHPYS